MEEIARIVAIHVQREDELPDAVLARDAAGAFLGSDERRQEQRGEYRNDCDDDEQFNERECEPSAPSDGDG